MKKLLSAVLVLAILGCGVAYADTDKEILFRDIPWGISISEVKNALSDFSIWRDVRGLHLAHWSDKKPSSGSGTENGYQGGCKNNDDEEPLEIAGYPCYIIVYCAYGLNENGEVLRDRKSSQFYMASYTFDTSDIDTKLAYEELKEKLIELYGVGEETTSDGGYGGMFTDNGTFSYHLTVLMTEWIGANNTAVLLRAEWDMDTGIGVSLQIVYGTTDYDNQLTAIEKALEKK